MPGSVALPATRPRHSPASGAHSASDCDVVFSHEAQRSCYFPGSGTPYLRAVASKFRMMPGFSSLSAVCMR